MAEKKNANNEMDEFRSNLEDVVNLAKKLSSVCETTAELVEVCELALNNDAQLKLLFKEATGESK